ncbi:AAA domain-containing protein [uncultured virus]|nr:AAA domain-containing protein [uncultured virus]
MDAGTVTNLITSNLSPSPSDEQLQIVEAAEKGHNIIVEATAGSGKTTTILQIATQLQDKRILQITYNARLKCEVRNKVSQLNLDNLDVHTYHSLCVKYYKSGFDDSALIDVLRHDRPLKTRDTFDLVIFDETQDMNDSYYRLVKKFLKDSQDSEYQLIFFGDSRQSVYGFSGAKPDYLIRANEYWTDHSFVRYQLTVSYRLTPEIAKFVNHCMIDTDLIRTVKPSNKKVRYISDCKPEKDAKGEWDYTIGIYQYLSAMLKKGDCKPEDIFILTHSIKETASNGRATGAAQLMNNLSKDGILVYKATDDEKFNDKLAEGKLVFCTHHGCKGMERPIVVIVNFCEEYFTYYAKDLNPKICPATLFVAATRASRELIVYQSGKVIPFLNTTNLHEICDVYGTIDKNKKAAKDQKDRAIPVTRLIKYLPAELLYDLNEMMAPLFEEILPEQIPISLDDEIKTSNSCEQVSDLNAIAIIGRFEEETTGKSSLIFNREFQDSGLVAAYETLMKQQEKDFEYYLKLSNYCWCSQEGLIYRHNQIKSYKWLNMVKWEDLKTNLKVVNKPVTYEVSIGDDQQCYAYKREDGKVLSISGIVDAQNDNEIWEFKCVKEITLEHRLQLLFYALMVKTLPLKEMVDWEKIAFYLLNARTGQLLQLRNHYETIEKIALLIINKRVITTSPDDDLLKPGPFIANLKENKSSSSKSHTKSNATGPLREINLKKLEISKGRLGYTVKELQNWCREYKVETTNLNKKEDIAKALMLKISI